MDKRSFTLLLNYSILRLLSVLLVKFSRISQSVYYTVVTKLKSIRSNNAAESCQTKSKQILSYKYSALRKLTYSFLIYTVTVLALQI